MVDWYNNPFVLINATLGIIAVVVLLGRGLILIGQWKGKVDEAQSTFKTNLDSFNKKIRAEIKEIRTETSQIRAEVNQIRIGIGQIRAGIDEIRTDIGQIRAGIDEIRTDIKGIFERIGSATAIGESPIKLTELGQEISARLDAGEIAESLVPQFRARVSGMLPYEVQELCFNYMNGDEFVPHDDVRTLILQCAFDKGLKRKQVLDVIAIELRDRLLPKQEE